MDIFETPFRVTSRANIEFAMLASKIPYGSIRSTLKIVKCV